MHTFLFEEGIWSAEGRYIDETRQSVPLRGSMSVTHSPAFWVNETRMTLELPGKSLRIETVYRINPFVTGSDFTKWESQNPGLGELRGNFLIVDDAILSSCQSLDHQYRGTEFLIRIEADRYLNRGALFSAERRISSWSLTLTRERK